MKRTVALLSLALVAAMAQAGVPLDATAEREIDDIFAALDSSRSPGCAVGVIDRGQLVFHRGYGMASLETGMAIDSRTTFYSGSVSKQFTAAAILLAAQKDYLNLDDPIRKWVPELPEVNAGVTVRHLVHHTSGIRDYLGLMQLGGIAFETPMTQEQVVALIARQKALNFEPGSEYLYSNSGYFLMAQIVGRATGSTLREFAAAEMFEPLGMRDTHFHDDRHEIVARRASAYAPAPEGKEGFVVAWSPAFDQVGSGGLITTIEDLARWERGAADRALGADFWPSMLQRGKLLDGSEIAYAFGISHREVRGLPSVQHSGGMFGYRAFLVRYPEHGVSVALLCNLASVNTARLAESVTAVVLADVIGPASEEPPRQASPEAPDETLEATDSRQWIGSYWSEELRATYQIAEGDSGLGLRINDGAQIPLTATADGGVELARRGVRAEATHVERGKVQTFELEAGRVRGITFQRNK